MIQGFENIFFNVTVFLFCLIFKLFVFLYFARDLRLRTVKVLLAFKQIQSRMLEFSHGIMCTYITKCNGRVEESVNYSHVKPVDSCGGNIIYSIKRLNFMLSQSEGLT